MVSGVLMKSDGTIQLREVRDELDEWYTLLGCTTIETFYVKIMGGIYTVICDEEGRLNGNDSPAILGRLCKDGGREIMAVGNIFICKTDGECFASLTTNEASEIMNSSRFLDMVDAGFHVGVRPVIFDAEW